MTVPSGSARRFRADVEGRSFDLSIEHGRFTVNDQGRAVSYAWLSERRLALLIDGRSYEATVVEEEDGIVRVQLGRSEFEVRLKDERDQLLERYGLKEAAGAGVREVRAPMPGLVLSVAVEASQQVEAGSGLLVLEAMKMENEICADEACSVKSVHVAAGDAVGKNDLLIELE